MDIDPPIGPRKLPLVSGAKIFIAPSGRPATTRTITPVTFGFVTVTVNS
jgi:hypothetical protein